MATTLAALAFVALPSRVQAACTISTTGVDFGSYNVFSAAPLDSAGTVTYRCTTFALVVSVTLGPGQSATYAPRQLRRASGTDRLEYNLYSDATRSDIFGDGTSGTSRHVGWLIMPNQDVPLNIYGRVPALQDVSIGVYTDTIIATINF